MDAGFNELSFSTVVFVESGEIIFDYLNSTSGLDAFSSADPTSLCDIVPSGSVLMNNDNSTETNSHQEESPTFSLLVAPSSDSPTCDLPLLSNEDLSFLDDIPTTSSQYNQPPDLLAQCLIDLDITESSYVCVPSLSQECEARRVNGEQPNGNKFSFFIGIATF